MANLDDLGYTSILDMSNDEAIETLRQIRLSRRVPVKSSSTKKKPVQKPSEINSDLAAQLLEILGGTNE